MKHTLFAIPTILVLALFLMSCTGQQNAYPSAPSPSTPLPTPVAPVAPVAPIAPIAPVAPVAPVAPIAPVVPATQTVNTDISNFTFSDVTIKAGDTVVWTNQDTAQHTVTSNSGDELSSLRLANGQTYSHTFMTAGTYTYHCSVHLTMKGKVTVT